MVRCFCTQVLTQNDGLEKTKGHKAAQKLPANHEEVLTNAFLCEAFIVCNHAIPAALHVNTDQTQMSTSRALSVPGMNLVQSKSQLSDKKRRGLLQSSQCRPSSWGKYNSPAQVARPPSMQNPRHWAFGCFL